MDRRNFSTLLSRAMLLSGIPLTSILHTEPSPSSSLSNKPISIWLNSSQRKYKQFTAEDWKKHLGNLRELGITIFHVRTDKKNLEAILKHKDELDIEVNRWLWIMNQPDATLIQQSHPEFFMVNREGNSILTHPPYVSYYKWLCPSRSEVMEFLSEFVGESLIYEELDGIHMDYIRYPEVILPRGLWEQYNVIQIEELPKFDYGYCEVCRNRFMEMGGEDPLKMPEPEKNLGWRHFRWDTISNVVQTLTSQIHANNKKVSASVFPTPYLGKKMVRQDWLSWDIDTIYPNMYHNFYRGDITWLEDVMADCMSQKEMVNSLHAALYLPAISKEDFSTYLKTVEGADGIGLFSEASLSRDYRRMLKEIREN